MTSSSQLWELIPEESAGEMSSHMKARTKSYRQQVVAELSDIPDEYLPLVLQLIRTYRESVMLKPAAESFRRGWREAMKGETFPIEELWEGIDGR